MRREGTLAALVGSQQEVALLDGNPGAAPCQLRGVQLLHQQYGWAISRVRQHANTGELMLHAEAAV